MKSANFFEFRFRRAGARYAAYVQAELDVYMVGEVSAGEFGFRRAGARYVVYVQAGLDVYMVGEVSAGGFGFRRAGARYVVYVQAELDVYGCGRGRVRISAGGSPLCGARTSRA